MLPLIAIAAGLVGCVMPPDAEYVQTPDDQPPRIGWPAQPAPYLQIVVAGPKCPDRDFRATLSDPDLNDTLYWLYFIDYHREPAQAATITEVKPADRSTPISFTVKGSDARFDPLTVGANEPHIVELVVSDRQFGNDRHIPPAGGNLTSVTWAVRYTADTQCE